MSEKKAVKVDENRWTKKGTVSIPKLGISIDITMEVEFTGSTLDQQPEKICSNAIITLAGQMRKQGEKDPQWFKQQNGQTITFDPFAERQTGSRGPTLNNASVEDLVEVLKKKGYTPEQIMALLKA